MQREEITFASRYESPTFLRTWTVGGTQLRIETEQKTLFPSFWASFHPLTLTQQINSFKCSRYNQSLWIFFDFNHLFSAILRKEYSYTLLSQCLMISYCLDAYQNMGRHRHFHHQLDYSCRSFPQNQNRNHSLPHLKECNLSVTRLWKVIHTVIPIILIFCRAHTLIVIWCL